MRKVPQGSEAEFRLYLPFMPFPLPAFVMLLTEALPEAPGTRFLDVGCGSGSKLLVARDLFGLGCRGIDRVPEYVAAARELGLDAECTDALGYPGYGSADIIWLNRPFRDPGAEAALEAQIWEQMTPGAIVICANLEAPPPSSWFIVADLWEQRRGIWMKPPGR
jgi:SAM-dependent methyltransferase